MAAPEVKRRLAAILAADVAGYTRLMSADEAGTVASLDAARLVFRDAIEHERGRVVDMAGDSVLAVFETATGAVAAALAVQKALTESEEASGDSHMRFRIGVHLGEVIEKPDGTVYGDGVNLAARLEGLAAPAGICISAVVSDQITDKVDAAFEDIGQHSVKNVAKPIHAFAWGGKREQGATTEPLSRKPTLALAQFESKGGDEADMLASGVRNDVMTSLSKQTGLELLTDIDRADYIVDLSVHGFGNRFRANISILERESGQHFAAERIDGDLADVFEARDALAYRAYNTMRYIIHERTSEYDRPDAELDCDTLLSRASLFLYQSNMELYLRARDMLASIIAKEPDNFMALAMDSLAHLSEVKSGYRAVTPEDGAIALEQARKAVAINQRSDFAHVMLCAARLFVEKDHAAAQREAERCLELNQHYALGQHMLGIVLTCAGDAERGLIELQEAVEAEAGAMDVPFFLRRVGLAHLVLGQYEDAVNSAARSDQREPDAPRTLLILAAGAALDGDDVTAAQAVKRMTALYPDFRIADFGNWPFRDPEPAERRLKGLRLAGLPE
jgi:adenylate cyclase